MPDLAVTAIAATLVILMALRLGLIVIGVEPWTVAWNVVDTLSVPLLWPFQIVVSVLGIDRAALDGRLDLADIAGALVYALLAAYLIATLTVRPNRP
jgi:hypothetical protein